MKKIRHPFFLFALLALPILLASAGRASTAANANAAIYLPAITRAFSPGIAPYVTELPEPANITAIADPGDGSLFVGMKDGRILIVAPDGELQPQPLLDIRDRVQAWPFEAGLLGVAIHPRFAENGYIYVYYTSGSQTEIASNVARFTVSKDGLASRDSEFLLLRFDQPALIHQGGDLKFGPQDGYLYIAVGDGGTARDSAGNAQSYQSIFGKILRIDVDNGDPYAIPADNPFAADTEKRGEVYVLGLRNPWRISFDRVSGDLFIGDVGESDWEEVNIVPAGSGGGQNFGWPCYEANDPFALAACNPDRTFTPPAHAYIHRQAQYHCSISGGFVYRGQRMPELAGHYLFADYCAGTLWALEPEEDGTWTAHNWGDQGQRWSTFGERSDGELFMGATGESTLYQIVPAGLPPAFAGN